ncbi:MAG: peptide ABC transporter substrate-binding protein [Ruminococcaceae bacterium]|nr:peptide ABC transporter substrate-binding protein [Oscillospiraceae bacterium]
MKKRLTATFLMLSLLVATAFLFTACEEDDGKGYIFGYNISSNPSSLDPQCANDRQSFLLIGTLFEGLLKCDNDGNIVPAGAESYIVSEDKLTYTFKLHENRYWTDANDFSEKVTANDYVYGFQRLFSPETRAPGAEDFYCIKNSEKITKKQMDVSQLGVKAVSDYELVITLDYPDSSFLMLLTTAPAMPCNEKYFLASQGKYGLTDKTTPSNGAFYLKSWSYDPWSDDNNNLILRYNEKYNEHNEVYPLGLNFFIEDTDGFLEDFYSGTSQNILLDGKKAEQLIKEGYSYEEYSTVTYGIMMNTKDSIFKDSMMRYALLYATDNSDLSLPFGFEKANGVVPYEVSDGKTIYREFAGNTPAVKPDSIKASSSYRKASENISKDELYSVTIIAVEGRDEELINSAQDIFQQWQAKLGFFCTIEYLSESAYNSAIQSGNYTLALARVTGEFNNPQSYLKNFTSSGYKYSSMDSSYQNLLQNAINALSVEESYEECKKAENKLLCDGRFIPVAYATEYFFSDKDCADVFYDPFSGAIDYTKAIYKD